MRAKIVFDVDKTNKEDIRNLVQMIREWELRTPKATVCGVLFETNPEISSEEAKQIFEGIFPEFQHLVEIPGSQTQLLRLGARGIVVQGKLVGTCDELTLSIGAAEEEQVKELQDAESISLIRMAKG